jgi:hypothetical protein
MKQLRTDPVYRKRLANHFGVSEAEIVDYADQHLEYSRLRRATKSSVWGVSRSGKTFRVTQNLPAGTPVFRIAGGPTVLKEVCGNVVTPVLPPVPRAVRRRGNVLPPGPLATNSEAGILDSVPGVPGFLPTSVPVGPEFTPAFAPAAASFPGEMMAVPAGITPGGVVAAGGGGFVPPFWLLAGAGAAFIHGDGGDSFKPPIPPPPPPPQVPEPASMLLLAAGALPLAGALRRRGSKASLPALRFSLRR